MAANEWLVVPADALASSVLLFAAVAKLAAPAALGRSLLKLTNNASLSSDAVVRGIGVIETAIALAILVQPVRGAADAALLVLGLAFISLGITGLARRIDEPCGCFGAASQQPLGTQNIVLGAVLAAIAVISVASTAGWSQDARAGAPIITAGLLGLASIAVGRSVLRPRPDRLELN